jgi:hypothetical protein
MDNDVFEGSAHKTKEERTTEKSERLIEVGRSYTIGEWVPTPLAVRTIMRIR